MRVQPPRGPIQRARGLLGALALLLACEWSGPDEFVPAAPYTPIRIPNPIEPAPEGEAGTLLQEYAARPPIDAYEAQWWELPFQAKRLVIALLITAAKDRIEDLPLVLTPDATWGLPEPSRFGARPIFGPDHGEAFLAALRTAAGRFPAKAKWQSQPMPPGPEMTVRAGAEPYWTYYVAGNDRIYFREVIYQGRARIDYVGLWQELPTERIQVRDQGPSPPLSPPPRRPRPAEGDDDASASSDEDADADGGSDESPDGD